MHRCRPALERHPPSLAPSRNLAVNRALLVETTDAETSRAALTGRAWTSLSHLEALGPEDRKVGDGEGFPAEVQGPCQRKKAAPRKRCSFSKTDSQVDQCLENWKRARPRLYFGSLPQTAFSTSRAGRCSWIWSGETAGSWRGSVPAELALQFTRELQSDAPDGATTCRSAPRSPAARLAPALR